MKSIFNKINRLTSRLNIAGKKHNELEDGFEENKIQGDLYSEAMRKV